MMPKEQRRAAVVAFVGAVSVFFAFLVFGGGQSPALVVGRKRASVMPSWTLAGGVEGCVERIYMYHAYICNA